MSKPGITTIIEELLTEKLKEVNIEIVEVEYIKENSDKVLRVYIDTESGVNLDICSIASRIVKDVIDEKEDVYYDHLEVSSLGIDRKLTRESDLIRSQGERVKIKTFKTFNGRKQFIGMLVELDPDHIILELEDEIIKVPRNMVSIIRLHPEI